MNFADYLDRSARFRSAIGLHVRNLLRNGVLEERAWAKSLCEAENVNPVLHCVKASDELCKHRLHQRNRERPEGSQPTTEEEFDEITQFFVPPDLSEGFEMKEYDADDLADATR